MLLDFRIYAIKTVEVSMYLGNVTSEKTKKQKKARVCKQEEVLIFFFFAEDHEYTNLDPLCKKNNMVIFKASRKQKNTILTSLIYLIILGTCADSAIQHMDVDEDSDQK